MNSSRRIPLVLVPLAAALLALASGCAGPSASTAAHSPATTVEYKQVFLTGSHIPVRVPASATARALPTTSPLTILTPDEFSRSLGPGKVPIN